MSAAMTPAQAVGAAFRKNGGLIRGATALTPFDEMARREDAISCDDERRIREEACAEWLAWLFEGGVDVGRATMRLFSYARRFKPELLGGMSAAQVGALFGQTRAAVIAREQAMFAPVLKKAGSHSTELPAGKSKLTREKCRIAQKGNRHRARSVKKRKPIL